MSRSPHPPYHIIASVASSFFFLLAAACTPDPPRPSQPLLDGAGELASSGQGLEAARLLRSKVASLPPAERARVWLELIRTDHGAGLYLNAIEDAEEAMRSGAGGAEILYLLGDSLRQLTRLEEAEKALAACLAADPGHLHAKLSLACIRFRADDVAVALPLFEDYFRGAAPGDSRHEEALIESGRALRAAGRHREAADRFVALLEKDPLDGKVYPELASTLYRLRLRDQGKFVEEIYKLIAPASIGEDVEKGLRESGRRGYAFAQRAAVDVQKRRFLSAYTHYRRAIEADPAAAVLRVDFGDFCLRLGRRRDARAALLDGFEKKAEPASGLWWLLARIHLEERSGKAALDSLREAGDALAREGDQGGTAGGQAPPFSLRLLRAEAFLEIGDLENAAGAALEAERSLAGAWEPAYWRGRVEMARGEAAAAAAFYAEALRRGGEGFLDLQVEGARAFEAIGNREEARAVLNRLLEANPGHLPLYEPLKRLETENPERRASIERAAANLAKIRGEIEILERAVDGMAIESAAEPYRTLVRLRLRLKDPEAFDALFILAEILPRDPEVLRMLLAGTREQKDTFVRLHLLRRLETVEPENTAALSDIVGFYVKLQVRLDEAGLLAARLHQRAPSAASHRFLGELALLRGEPAAAIEVLRRGLEAHPGDAGLRGALTRAESAAAAGEATR